MSTNLFLITFINICLLLCTFSFKIHQNSRIPNSINRSQHLALPMQTTKRETSVYELQRKNIDQNINILAALSAALAMNTLRSRESSSLVNRFRTQPSLTSKPYLAHYLALSALFPSPTVISSQV
jgi:hypothetical protein